MSPRLTTSIGAAILVLSGCSDYGPTPPSSLEAAGQTLASVNGPAQPGNSFVVRLDGTPFLTTTDETQDLVVRHYDAGNIDFCGGSSSFPSGEEQLVFTPNGTIDQFRTGEIPVYIYRLSEVPPGVPSCEDLETRWLYHGTHRLLSRDNNLFGDPTHGNAFGFFGDGTVYDPNGQAYHYYERFSLVWDPVRDVVFRAEYLLSIK